jgi:hypothetical protein
MSIVLKNFVCSQLLGPIWSLVICCPKSHGPLSRQLARQFSPFMHSARGILDRQHFDSAVVLAQEQYILFFRIRFELGNCPIAFQTVFSAIQNASFTDDTRELFSSKSFCGLFH